MFDGPPILFFLILFGFVLLIIKMGMDHEKWKAMQKSKPHDDGSLRLSELEAIIRKTVQEAVSPLETRVERLEAHAPEPARRLPGAAPEAALPPADFDEELARRERR